jgi:phosphomethylpyrimidine synthase
MMMLLNGLTIGHEAPVRINCNIGCNSADDYELEIQKIDAIRKSGLYPDMMMDLSLLRMRKPLYRVAHEELGVEVGTVLSYLPFCKSNGLDWKACKRYLIELCVNGISFVTIHFTATKELFELARSTRQIPVTSRGGAMCLYDMKLHQRENVFIQHIDEIADIALRYDVAISLGTTFRPSNIFDACDEVHLQETKEQLKVCRYLQAKGVKVMVENVGHIGLDKLKEHSKMLRQFNAPIMPLGPLPTDSAIGYDHVANAIGGSFAAYWGCAHVINCVTRQEHTGKRITVDDTIEAIRCAKLVAHSVNVARGFELDEDRMVSDKRLSTKKCMGTNESCVRCKDACPLILI